MADTIEVDMIVEAISKGFSKVSADMNKMSKAGEDSGKKIPKANKEIGMSFTELNSVVSLAKQGYAILKGVLDETVGATMDYSRSVREMAQSMGLSTEETSRMIQLADDYLISIDEMRVAMQMATKNGFAPGVEGLAQLAD